MKYSHQNSSDKTTPDAGSAKLISNAARLAADGNYLQALESLSSGHSSSLDIRNARAVCLMRLGRIDAAVQTLRSLVLQAGCTRMKPGLPVIHRTNFATSLLLADLPGGVRETLSEVKETDHSSVIRLRNALEDWEARLSWWQRFNWKLGGSPDVPITIDFPPGEFVDPLTDLVTTPSQVAMPRYNDTHHVA